MERAPCTTHLCAICVSAAWCLLPAFPVGPSSASAPNLVKSLIMQHMWELHSPNGKVEALYYDPDDNVANIQSWLDHTYSMFITRPAASSYGAPPLLISGLIKVRGCPLIIYLPAMGRIQA